MPPIVLTNTMKKVVVVSGLIILLFAKCDQGIKEDAFKSQLDKILSEKSYHQQIDHFVIPDSITTSLIVATFFEHHEPAGHSLIVYSDTGRKTAIKIKYLPDSTVQTDHLILTKHNEFKSKTGTGDYIVRENTVIYMFTNSGIGATFEFDRTDKTAIDSRWR